MMDIYFRYWWGKNNIDTQNIIMIKFSLASQSGYSPI